VKTTRTKLSCRLTIDVISQERVNNAGDSHRWWLQAQKHEGFMELRLRQTCLQVQRHAAASRTNRRWQLLPLAHHDGWRPICGSWRSAAAALPVTGLHFTSP
jgi:hypothetical protein